MTIAEKVIENPIQGDRVVFRKTAKDTNGELLEFDLFIEPGATGPPEHVHLESEEQFIVLAGKVEALMDGKKYSFNEGEQFIIPAGTPHSWWNSGQTEAQVRIQFSPASRMEEFLETIYGLAKDGKTNAEGVPGIWQLSVTAPEYFNVTHITKPPLIIQKFIFGILGPIARLRGYKSDYPYPHN